MPEVKTEEWIDQVLDEHRELREALARLRGFLEGPRPEVGQKGAHRWSSELSSQLVTLHDKLFRHFRYEDDSGMVETLTQRHPRATRRIEELSDEHPAMLQEIRNLTFELLAYSEGRPRGDTAFRRRLTTLLDQLDRHERDETDLIQRLEYRDLGAGD